MGRLDEWEKTVPKGENVTCPDCDGKGHIGPEFTQESACGLCCTDGEVFVCEYCGWLNSYHGDLWCDECKRTSSKYVKEDRYR